MSAPAYSVVKLASGYDLEGFDCGEPIYNDWLFRHAAAAVHAGVAAVYLLIENIGDQKRGVGYYAINPTKIVRHEVPKSISRGWPRAVPAWKLGKLAVHVDLRSDKDAQRGRQLLRHALETVIRVADAGGGKVIVVDADDARLDGFYVSNGFTSTGIEGNLSLTLKISTARKALRG